MKFSPPIVRDLKKVLAALWSVLLSQPMLVIVLIALHLHVLFFYSLDLDVFINLLFILIKLMIAWFLIEKLASNKPKSINWKGIGVAYIYCIIYGLAVTVGLILLIVPGLMAAVYGSIGITVIFREHCGFRLAFNRSNDLIKGHFWQAALYLFSPLVIYVVTTIVALSTSNTLLASQAPFVVCDSAAIFFQLCLDLIHISAIGLTFPLYTRLQQHQEA